MEFISKFSLVKPAKTRERSGPEVRSACAMSWWVALLGGFVAGQMLSGCFSAMQATGEAWSGDAGKEAHRNAMAADIVTLPIQAPLLAGLGVLAVLDRASEKQGEKDRAKYAELKALVRADPEIVIRERWDVSKDQKRRTTIWASLSDPQIPYTADQLEKIYATVPSLRWSVFEHPACRPEFLAAQFSEAKAISSKNSSLLETLVTNPSMPIDLVEEIAESGYVFGNAREKAKMALSRRLPDKDRDGLPDKWEIKEGTDPNVPDANKDTDHDGLDNRHEYLLGLHPTNPDSDGDELTDGFEIQISFNPAQPLKENTQLPAPTKLQAFPAVDARLAIRWLEQDSDKHHFTYLVYRDGKLVQFPRPSSNPFFVDEDAKKSGEFVYNVRVYKAGALSRPSVGLRVKIEWAKGRLDILEQKPEPN